MKIVSIPRQSGKTTDLIKLASEEWYYIICSNRQRACYIADMATKLNLDIPFPITFNELPLRSKFIKGVLIDDFEELLHLLVGGNIPIIQMTTSEPLEVRKE